MSKFNPQKAFYAVCITVVLLGCSYCAAEINKPAPVVKLELQPGDFRIVSKGL